MKAENAKTNKGQKLTLKQKKLVEALPKSDSVAEAGEKAGYCDRQTAHRALKGISERAPEILERLGLTIEHVADKCLRPLLDAKETKFFASNGVVMEEREVAASDIRLRAVDLWAKLKGAYTAQKVQVSGGLSLDFNHVSDDELDRAIAELTEPSEPPAKA
jgi:hypothetical protein